MNAKLLKTLGHTKRLEIISLLRGHALTVNQISQMIALRQASVSQHLSLLKSSRLVSTSREGKEIYYTLNPAPLLTLSRSLAELLSAHSSLEPAVTDPVCSMQLTPSRARYSLSHNGVKHYFCGRGCLKIFQQEYQ